MSDDPQIPRARQSEDDRTMLAQTRAAIARSRHLLVETKPLLNVHGIRRDRDSVSITAVGHEWHVFVEQAGQRSITRAYGNQRSALDYAEEKRGKLNLITITLF